MLCCESSTTQGLFLSSDVIPIRPHTAHGVQVIAPVLWWNQALLLPTPPEQASLASPHRECCIARAPDTRMSLKKVLGPENSPGSRKHNPVPYPQHFLLKNHPTFPSSKYLAWVPPSPVGKSISLPPTL